MPSYADSAFDAFAPRLDNADLISALREQLTGAVTRLRELRSLPVDACVADEIACIRFLAARLGRRLRALGQDGLLHVSVCQAHSLLEVLQCAVEEVREECGRRGIESRIEIEDAPPPMWMDRDQLAEALRCVLDEAISAGCTNAITIGVARARGGRLEVSVRAEASCEGAGEADATSCPGVAEPAALRHEVARRLLALMGGETLVRLRDQSREFVLLLPPGRPPATSRGRAGAGRVYVFPTPTAA